MQSARATSICIYLRSSSILTSYLRLGLPSGLSFRFSNKSPSFDRANCLLFGEPYKLWTSPLYSFYQLPVSASDAQIFWSDTHDPNLILHAWKIFNLYVCAFYKDLYTVFWDNKNVTLQDNLDCCCGCILLTWFLLFRISLKCIPIYFEKSSSLTSTLFNLSAQSQTVITPEMLDRNSVQ